MNSVALTITAQLLNRLSETESRIYISRAVSLFPKDLLFRTNLVRFSSLMNGSSSVVVYSNCHFSSAFCLSSFVCLG